MYQRAVKVARVLEENEKETQILNLERKRREQFRQNPQNRTEKRSRSDYPPEKGKQPMSKASNNPPVNTVGDHIVEYVYFARVDALNAERRGIKGVGARNSLGSKTGPHSQQGRLGLRPLDHRPHQPEGDRQRLARHNGLEITTSRRQEDASFV